MRVGLGVGDASDLPLLAESAPTLEPGLRPAAASIIVCTRNRAVSLREALASICAMERDPSVPTELIVVDNGSTDATADVVASIALEAPIPVKYLLETRKGVSIAKNRGLAASCGELIMFTDDDCVVRSDWLTTAIRLFASNPRGVFGGRVDLHNPADLPITIKTSLKPDRLRTAYEAPGFLHGCNMVFCRHVLDRIGPFDVRFGPGSPLHAAEDTDLVYRGYCAGYSVTYEPDLVVSHNHGRSTWAAYKRLAAGYKCAIGAMAMKYLIAGDTSLAKSIYWTMRAGFRNWRAGRIGRNELVLETQYFWGAIRYIVTNVAPRWRGL
jgi:glycosyltransferase involved in cell wall biosynthesis